jgi:hypothetical protein
VFAEHTLFIGKESVSFVLVIENHQNSKPAMNISITLTLRRGLYLFGWWVLGGTSMTDIVAVPRFSIYVTAALD